LRSQPNRDSSLHASPALWQRKPTAARIALGGHLRRLREARAITREVAADTIHVSSSKISRLELGRGICKEGEVAALLTLYGIIDPEERETLLSLVRQASAPGWWHEYGDVLPNSFQTYLGLEQAASVIRVYEPHLVPGLLQTEDYARAVLRRRYLQVSHGEIERRVALRMACQAFLNQPGAPELWVALDEAALRRSLGDQTVHQAQLHHLIEMAQRPNVRLQIVPCDAGNHTVAGGPFTILRFAEPDLPDIVYLEHLTNALCLDKKRDTVEYLAILDNLCVHAAPPTETTEFLHRIINEGFCPPINQTAAVVAALGKLDTNLGDRVLIMLPDGPGFAEAFAGAIEQGAVPLPVDPLLTAHDIVTVAAEAGAKLVLVFANRLPELADLEAEPPVFIDGPHGRWAAALRLRQAGNPQTAD
jgi:hypothetical protein